MYRMSECSVDEWQSISAARLQRVATTIRQKWCSNGLWSQPLSGCPIGVLTTLWCLLNKRVIILILHLSSCVYYPLHVYTAPVLLL